MASRRLALQFGLNSFALAASFAVYRKQGKTQPLVYTIDTSLNEQLAELVSDVIMVKVAGISFEEQSLLQRERTLRRRFAEIVRAEGVSRFAERNSSFEFVNFIEVAQRYEVEPVPAPQDIPTQVLSVLETPEGVDPQHRDSNTQVIIDIVFDSFELLDISAIAKEIISEYYPETERQLEELTQKAFAREWTEVFDISIKVGGILISWDFLVRLRQRLIAQYGQPTASLILRKKIFQFSRRLVPIAGPIYFCICVMLSIKKHFYRFDI